MVQQLVGARGAGRRALLRLGVDAGTCALRRTVTLACGAPAWRVTRLPGRAAAASCETRGRLRQLWRCAAGDAPVPRHAARGAAAVNGGGGAGAAVGHRAAARRCWRVALAGLLLAPGRHGCDPGGDAARAIGDADGRGVHDRRHRRDADAAGAAAADRQPARPARPRCCSRPARGEHPSPRCSAPTVRRRPRRCRGSAMPTR